MNFKIISAGEISNIEKEEIDSYLNPAEFVQYQIIKPHKRSDWLSGRIALKLAFQEGKCDDITPSP